MANAVVRGVYTTLDALFYSDDGVSPQFVVGGVKYTIIAFNGMPVGSGIAEQDRNNLARWLVHFTIPLSAPVTGPNDVYILTWSARRTDGGYNKQTDRFIVVDPADQSEEANYDSTTIAMTGQPFTLNLRTPDNNISQMSLRLVRAGFDNPVVTLTGLINELGNGISPIPDGNNFRYPVEIAGDDLAPINYAPGGNGGGLAYWFAYYNYIDSYSQQQTVVNPIYIVNSTVIALMNSVNKYCNILRNRDVVKELQITESKLVHFVYEGLLRVNACSPGNFGFDFNTLMSGRWGQTFYFYVEKAAQLELLNSLYLGEGMSAFEFSGMTVQLNSDRTGYISQAISTLENDLNTNLPRVKSQYGRSGGGSGRMGTIGLSLSAVSNITVTGISGFGSYGGLGFNGSLGIPPIQLPFLL